MGSFDSQDRQMTGDKSEIYSKKVRSKNAEHSSSYVMRYVFSQCEKDPDNSRMSI